MHPELADLLNVANGLGFKVIITTNGTLLGTKGDILLESPAVYKVSISVHSFEANENTGAGSLSSYLNDAFVFAEHMSKKDKICVFRLWNLNGEDTVGENDKNPEILDKMRRFFGGEWTSTRSGMRIKHKIFLEYGERFEWPNPEAAETDDSDRFCYGLRDQIGILCDGTVVPCCLDSEGTVSLGNIFEKTLDEILKSDAAVSFYNSFTQRRSPCALCSNCGYARRFSNGK
jgi:radical SAM protein with 4Fe4S-binding SPASM domain